MVQYCDIVKRDNLSLQGYRTSISRAPEHTAGGQLGQQQLLPQMSHRSMHRAPRRQEFDPAIQALAKFIRIALDTRHVGGQRARVNENVSGRHGPNAALLRPDYWTLDFV